MDGGALKESIEAQLTAGGFTFESAGAGLGTEWYVRHPDRDREVAKLGLSMAKCTLDVSLL